MSKKNLSQDEVTSLPKSLIQVGIPLPFPVYDFKGQLLMQEGAVVSSEDQLVRLQDRGLYLNKKTIDQLPSSKPLTDAEKQKLADAGAPQEQLVDLKITDIKLGETLNISPLTDETNSTKYSVKFLGGQVKGSLICTAPKLDEKLVYVKEGSGFMFRLFSGKDMLNFTSIITAINNTPYPHIHLKWPAGVYSKPLRQHPRVETNIICSIVNEGNEDFKGTKFSGRMTDLSVGGTKIETRAQIGALNDKAECRFKLKLINKEIFFSVPCVLRNAIAPSDADSSQKYTLGLQFEKIPFEELIMLQNYIYQLSSTL